MHTPRHELAANRAQAYGVSLARDDHDAAHVVIAKLPCDVRDELVGTSRHDRANKTAEGHASHQCMRRAIVWRPISRKWLETWRIRNDATQYLRHGAGLAGIPTRRPAARGGACDGDRAQRAFIGACVSAARVVGRRSVAPPPRGERRGRSWLPAHSSRPRRAGAPVGVKEGSCRPRCRCAQAC